MMQPPDLLTPREVAEILKISYENALSLIKYGGLRAIKLGRQYRVSAKDLADFINKGGTK